jgi:hypothetical protein
MYKAHRFVESEMLALNVVVDVRSNLAKGSGVGRARERERERTHAAYAADLGMEIVEALVVLSLVGVLNARSRA